ncbi:MAG: type II toxin-antitoxin system VapC family toxin [Oscillatoria princeps RMCB-10]|jgi:predicted nucleic acid-binding protein|nr:type II toxin-antitoxin system VapC family toxin [Oscillatoria princeps RMCB-10]
MATYLVDTSVVIEYFIRQTHTPEARVLVARMGEGDRLYIPEFGLLECANVLWKEVRFRGMPETDAAQSILDMLDLPFQILPVSNLLPSALQIGLSYQLPVYDSLYIALALDRGFPLITVDRRQADAAMAAGAVIKPIEDFSPA